MRDRLKVAAWCLILTGALATAAAAQAPAGGDSVVVESPTYVEIPMEIMVDRPAAEVWDRIGGYCDIAEWGQVPCEVTSGDGVELGSVRSLGNEVLVGKSQYSYTYAQTPRDDRPYNLYHGTLEVRPETATASKIVYTLVYDVSMLDDDAAEADIERRRTIFTELLGNMKILVEGGTLPPADGPGR